MTNSVFIPEIEARDGSVYYLQADFPPRETTRFVAAYYDSKAKDWNYDGHWCRETGLVPVQVINPEIARPEKVPVARTTMATEVHARWTALGVARNWDGEAPLPEIPLDKFVAYSELYKQEKLQIIDNNIARATAALAYYEQEKKLWQSYDPETNTIGETTNV